MLDAPSLQSGVTTSQRTRNVALFGLFGAGNLGNDGSLEAFLHFLRCAPFPVDVTCICYDEREVRERFGIKTIPIAPAAGGGMPVLNKTLLKIPNHFHNIMRAFSAARSFDSIFVPGTGILDDFVERWQGMPYHLALWGTAARLAGVPFGFVSIGAGPILHPMSRRLMVSAARMARYRSFRDQASKDYMANLGVDTTRDPVTPDIAFSLPFPKLSSSRAQSSEDKAQDPIIGIGIMSYFGWKHRQGDGLQIYRHFMTQLSDFALWLLERGFRVRLLIGDYNDLSAMAELADNLRKLADGAFANRICAEPAHSLTDIVIQMADTELVVTTRFHNVVCALMSSKPVLSIGYAKKNDLLLELAGLGQFVQRVETLDLERLKQQFVNLYEDRAHYIPKIARMSSGFRADLERQQAQLLEFISRS